MAHNDTLERPATLDGGAPDPFAGLSDVIDDIIAGRVVGQQRPAAPAALPDELLFLDAKLDAIDTGFLSPTRQLPVPKPVRLDEALAPHSHAEPAIAAAPAAPQPAELFGAPPAQTLPPEVLEAPLRGALSEQADAALRAGGLAASVKALFAGRPSAPAPMQPETAAEPVSAQRQAPALQPDLLPVVARSIPAPALAPDEGLAEALSGNGSPYEETPATESFSIPALQSQTADVPPPAPVDDELDFYEIVRTRTPHSPARLSTGGAPGVSAEARMAGSGAPEFAPAESASAEFNIVQDELIEEISTPQPNRHPAASGSSFDDFAAYFDEQNNRPSADAVQADPFETPLNQPAETLAAPVEGAAMPAARRSRKGLYVAAGVIAVALAGAAPAFLGGGSGMDGGEAPVIVRADPEPVRVAPQDPGGTQVPNQDSVVLNEVAGGQAQPQPLPSQPELVEGREEPIISGAPVKVEERVPGTGNTEAGEPALAVAVPPRQVQTVTVRPDGTIVTDAPAAVAALPEPATQPAAEPQAAATAPEPALAPVPAEPQAAAEPQPAALPDVAPAPSPAPSPEPAAAAPQPVREAAPAPEPLVVPGSRPADQPLNVTNEAAAAPAQTEAEVAAAAPAAIQPGGFAMQISSQPSEAAAVKSLQDLGRRFGSILGGRDYAIQKAEVPGKGTFYRVRILAPTREDANDLCARYKAAGGSCFVTR